MVLCGPCVVMMPNSGNFQRNTRIPTFSFKGAATRQPETKCEDIPVSRLPQMKTLTKETVNKTRYNVPDSKSTNYKLNSISRDNERERPTQVHSIRLKSPNSANSLALPPKRNMYVGTRPLKSLKENTLQTPKTPNGLRPNGARLDTRSQPSMIKNNSLKNTRLPKSTKSNLPPPKPVSYQTPTERRSHHQNGSLPQTFSQRTGLPISSANRPKRLETKQKLDSLQSKYKIKPVNNRLVNHCKSSYEHDDEAQHSKLKTCIPRSRNVLNQEAKRKSRNWEVERGSLQQLYAPRNLQSVEPVHKHSKLERKPTEDTQRHCIVENEEDNILDMATVSQDILDFSIESGEELASDEDSPIRKEDIQELISDSDEEESENKSGATVIYQGIMERSNDTNEDSFDSLEETRMEPFPTLHLIEEDKEETNISEKDDVSEEYIPSDHIDPERLGVRERMLRDDDVEDPYPNFSSSNGCNSPEGDSFSAESFSKRINHSDDDSDFIDVDCEVQPMRALHRPLVYGCASRLPAFTRKMISDQNHLVVPGSEWNTSHLIQCQKEVPTFSDPNWVESSSLFSNVYKETYWDYFKAKSKDKQDEQKSFYDPLSPYDETRYDPEILLAQVTHPKSLKNATFNEYSTQIKSSIMERLSSNSDSDDIDIKSTNELGSWVDLSRKSEIGLIDPGYYSESDVSKLKKGLSHYRSSDFSDSASGLSDHVIKCPTLATRTLSPPPKPYSIGEEPENIEQTSLANNHHNRYTWNDLYPLEIKDYRTSLGEDPWMKLLEKVTSPSRDSNNSSDGETYYNFNRKPSVTSLPTWASSWDSGSGTRSPSKEKLVRVRGSASPPLPPLPTSKKDKPKKSKKRSFLPSYFRKKADSPPASDLDRTSVEPTPPPPPTKKNKGNTTFFVGSVLAKSPERRPTTFTKDDSSPSLSSSSSSSKSNRSGSSRESVLTVIRGGFQNYSIR